MIKNKIQIFLYLLALSSNNWSYSQNIKLDHFTIVEYVSSCIDSLYDKDSMNYSSIRSVRVDLYSDGRFKTACLTFRDKNKVLSEPDCDLLYRLLDNANYSCVIEGLSQWEIENKMFVFEIKYRRKRT